MHACCVCCCVMTLTDTAPPRRTICAAVYARPSSDTRGEDCFPARGTKADVWCVSVQQEGEGVDDSCGAPCLCSA